MSMFHGGAWRSTPACGLEGAPRRSVLPHISPLTGYVQAFTESPSPSTRLGQLQVKRVAGDPIDIYYHCCPNWRRSRRETPRFPWLLDEPAGRDEVPRFCCPD